LDQGKEIEMRIIGIDLALTSTHKAVVMDDRGKFLTPVFAVATLPEAMAGLLQQAREGVEASCPVVVVMEPTGLAWLPVTVYMLLHGVTVYLVNSQQVADLRRFYKRHAKSDRIDARVLAKLWWLRKSCMRCACLQPPDMPCSEHANN
jgi:transposase